MVLFLYVPMFTLIILSFNKSRSRATWGGFSLNWYKEMLNDKAIMNALWNTILIALISSVIAVVIGTLASLAISKMKRRRKSFYLGITNIPMLNADIVTGISLLLSFIAFGISLGFKTILLAHITFNLPYVILSILPKLAKDEQSLQDAALDLGASEVEAFFKVTLPDIMPGVLSGFLLAFTMSLDDFIITYFTKGAGINTLSTLIYSQTKRGVKPSIYALSTIIFLLVFIILVLLNFFQNKKKEKVLK
ncbi:MAG: ABC transporter permease [Eubacteriales bacterium]|nr:ABC transporter permease [Eubacteriales bacterium]